MDDKWMIEENARRLAAIKCVYDPITGRGSTSIERKEVVIAGCPVGKLLLPTDFASTGFVTELSALGFDGYIEKYLRCRPNKDLRDTLWEALCIERVKYDFEFWACSCIIISAKGQGRNVPFVLNRPQRAYLRELERLRLSNRPIDIILCKARQWGGSTLTQLYMLWIQLVHRRNWNSVICAQVEAVARNITGMLHKAVRHMPAWSTDGVALVTSPYQGSPKTRVLSLSGSRYSVGSAERPDGLRSEDISMAHLTEVGVWKDTKGKKPEDLVQSIFGSILSGPYTVKVLESTAKGVGNYFHRTWLDAVEGKNNFTPVFIPWFMIDLYSKPIEDYGAFVAAMDERDREMFSLGATLEAIAWYKDKSREMRDQWRMCSEYPSTASEAFQSSGSRIFPMAYVESVRATTKEACLTGEFVAAGVKGPGALRDIRLEQRQATSGGTDGLLQVWQLPDDTEAWHDRYVVSVDVGGAGELADYSVIKVADRLPMTEVGGVPEVVAEWHGHTEHDLLIWKAAQIAEAYGHALLVVESNTLETEGTEGDNFDYVLDEVVGYYDNLYSRTPPEQIRQGAPVRYGFHTNVHTKPTVINFLKAAMRDGLYIERCRQTTFEMDTFELKPDGRTMGAADGCHDDLVMATAILVYVCYKWEPPRKAVAYTPSNRTKIVSEASI